MPAKDFAILGIDIRPDEIHVVEMRGSWTDPRIVNAASIATPPGSVENGRIIQVEPVSRALRILVQRMRVTARDAVIGLGARVVTARTVEVPDAPEEEMPAILQGEMEHYHLAQEGQSAFGYMRLAGAARAVGAAGNRIVVLLMSAENRIVSGYREVADLAGLRLVALEPILVSQFRAAYAHFGAESVACLSISPTRADIIFTNADSIRLYRRVEIGTDDLFAGRSKGLGNETSHQDEMDTPQQSLDATRFPTWQNADGESPYDILPAAEGPALFPDYIPPVSHVPPPHVQSLAALILELQRSLDYYARTFPALGHVDKIVIATTDTEMDPIADTISTELGIEVLIAPAPPTDPISPITLNGPVGLQFVGAAGLAMHEIPGHPTGMPRLDLSSKERAISSVKAVRGKLTMALAASILMLAIGLGTAFAFGTRANRVAHELDHEHDHLAGQQRLLRTLGDELAAQNNRLAALQPRGIPLARIMDSITGAISPQADLVSVALDAGGHVQISGNASNERAVIATVERLRASPFFENPSVDSFGSPGQGKDAAPSVQFQISGQIVGASPATAAPRNATGNP
jgi:Tfp pilus assembly PilM family ATPase